MRPLIISALNMYFVRTFITKRKGIFSTPQFMKQTVHLVYSILDGGSVTHNLDVHNTLLWSATLFYCLKDFSTRFHVNLHLGSA